MPSQPIAQIGNRTYSGDNLYSGLQHELMIYKQNGGTFKALSKKCHGHPVVGTIGKIAYGTTKEPRMSSVVLLYYALGFTVSASKDD